MIERENVFTHTDKEKKRTGEEWGRKRNIKVVWNHKCEDINSSFEKVTMQGRIKWGSKVKEEEQKQHNEKVLKKI